MEPPVVPIQDSDWFLEDDNDLTGGIANVTTSSVNTVFTATTVVDASAWDLSSVEVGDVAVASGGSTGSITIIDDGADTLTVSSWVGGTPIQW